MRKTKVVSKNAMMNKSHHCNRQQHNNRYNIAAIQIILSLLSNYFLKTTLNIKLTIWLRRERQLLRRLLSKLSLMILKPT